MRKLSILTVLALTACNSAGIGSPPTQEPTPDPSAGRCETQTRLLEGRQYSPNDERQHPEGWTYPEKLTVHVDGVRQPDRLITTVRLHNSDSEPLWFLYTSDGRSRSLFTNTKPLRFKLPVEEKPQAEMHMSAGHTGLKIPPGKDVVFETTLCQSDYESKWPKSMKVEWSVSALSKAPSGSFER